jgi:predicted TPR repeat methyltransferase
VRRAKGQASQSKAREIVHRAKDLHRQGQVAQATEMYRRALAVSPDDPDALHFLGIAEHQQGRSEEALRLMARAIEIAPLHPDVHSNRGNVLRQMGQLEEAEGSYRKALELRPADATTLNNLAALLRDRGRLDEAVTILSDLAKVNPGAPDVRQNLGECLLALGRLDEGLAAFREAIRIRPSALAYRRMGAIFYRRGQIADAAGAYREWLSFEPESAEAQHLLAACTEAGAPARASDDFVRTLFDRFAPSFDHALGRLDYRAPALVAGAVAAGLGEPARDLEVLDAGCGTGLCAESLRPYARTLVGVDLSRNMLERARTRDLYDSLVEAELTEFLKGHPGAYDVIASADTLVYFGALEEVIGAGARALRGSGLLVFTVERSAEADAPAGYRLHPHGRYSHTDTYVRSVLSGAGMESIQIEPVDLRKEAGSEVGGWLVTARRGGSPSP